MELAVFLILLIACSGWELNQDVTDLGNDFDLFLRSHQGESHEFPLEDWRDLALRTKEFYEAGTIKIVPLTLNLVRAPYFYFRQYKYVVERNGEHEIRDIALLPCHDCHLPGSSYVTRPRPRQTHSRVPHYSSTAALSLRQQNPTYTKPKWQNQRGSRRRPAATKQQEESYSYSYSSTEGNKRPAMNKNAEQTRGSSVSSGQQRAGGAQDSGSYFSESESTKKSARGNTHSANPSSGDTQTGEKGELKSGDNKDHTSVVVVPSPEESKDAKQTEQSKENPKDKPSTAEPPKPVGPKAEAPKADTLKSETTKSDPAKPKAPKPEPELAKPEAAKPKPELPKSQSRDVCDL